MWKTEERKERMKGHFNKLSLMEQMRSENNSKSHPKKQRLAKSTDLRHTIFSH